MPSSFFNSIEPPFSSLSNPRFFFPSRQHDEALTTLLQGIDTRAGLLILTGERGVGKTTLCRVLLDRLGHHIKRSFIFHTPPTPDDLIQQIHDDFGLPTTGNSAQDREDVLNPFLVRNRLDGEDAIVIVDDAHDLSPDCLDAIGALFQTGTHPEQLIQVVLVGDLALLDTLAASTVPTFGESKTTCYHLEPLEQEELKNYISYRCRVAGCRGDIPFSVGAVTKIYQESGGLPGNINQICAATFDSAARQGTVSITDDLVVLPDSKSMANKRARVSQPSVAMPSVAPPVTVTSSQWLPKHLQRGVVAVIIGVLGFGVWLGWVMKPEGVAVDTTVASVTTAPTEPSRDYRLGPAGLVRAAQESRTAPAAMLTLLNQWSAPGTMRIDSFPFELSLLERLDYPAVITWRTEEHAPLTSAVLFALNADTATILDPLSGVLHVKREVLSERVVGEAKIFWQPVPGLFPPFQSEDKMNSLETLQQLLDQLGFGGIKELQQFYGFEPTGIFTKEVHLVLGKEMHGQQVPSLMLAPLGPVTK